MGPLMTALIKVVITTMATVVNLIAIMVTALDVVMDLMVTHAIMVMVKVALVSTGTQVVKATKDGRW